MSSEKMSVPSGTVPVAYWAADINHRYSSLPSAPNDGVNRLMPRLAYKLVDMLPHVSISLTRDQERYVLSALEEIARRVLPTMDSPYSSLSHVDAELHQLINYIDTNGFAFYPRPQKPSEQRNGAEAASVQAQNGHVHKEVQELLS